MAHEKRVLITQINIEGLDKLAQFCQSHHLTQYIHMELQVISIVSVHHVSVISGGKTR